MVRVIVSKEVQFERSLQRGAGFLLVGNQMIAVRVSRKLKVKFQKSLRMMKMKALFK